MSNEIHSRIKRAAYRTKLVWWAVMALATWWTVTNLTPLAWLLLVPFAFLSYTVLLFITVQILASTIPHEELMETTAQRDREETARAKLEVVAKIAERQAAGEDVPNEEVFEALNAAGVEVVRVTDAGPVVGTYLGNDIYEFILVQMPKREGVDRMDYHGPAEMVNGMAQIPVVEGKVFACVNDILYAKDTA